MSSVGDSTVQRIVKPVPERALLVYTVDEPVCVPADRVVAAVTAPPGDQAILRQCYVIYFQPHRCRLRYLSMSILAGESLHREY